jgi:hypothetical protein
MTSSPWFLGSGNDGDRSFCIVRNAPGVFPRLQTFLLGCGFSHDDLTEDLEAESHVLASQALAAHLVVRLRNERYDVDVLSFADRVVLIVRHAPADWERVSNGFRTLTCVE